MDIRQPPRTGLDPPSRFNRRHALRLIGASLTLAEVASCARPSEPAPRVENEDLYGLDDNASAQLLARSYSGRILLSAATRRATTRASRRTTSIAPVAIFNTLVVFDRDDLDGGGLTFGQDFSRTLLELGLGRCERLFEFCAGPAYIGYSLLANGFCERLTLADINPVSVEAARKTAEFNNIQRLVNTYVSDSLKQIPDSETWDLVVGNPPHFRSAAPADTTLLLVDPEWSLHRDFYRSVKRFMKPGGRVLLVENREASNERDFEPMIREGGGTLLTSRAAVTIGGKQTPYYYMMSGW